MQRKSRIFVDFRWNYWVWVHVGNAGCSKRAYRRCHRPPCGSIPSSPVTLWFHNAGRIWWAYFERREGRSVKALWSSDSVWNPLELAPEFWFWSFWCVESSSSQNGKGKLRRDVLWGLDRHLVATSRGVLQVWMRGKNNTFFVLSLRTLVDMISPLC